MRLQCEERVKVTEVSDLAGQFFSSRPRVSRTDLCSMQEELQRACRAAEAAATEQQDLRQRLAAMEEEAAAREAHKSKESAVLVSGQSSRM